MQAPPQVFRKPQPPQKPPQKKTQKAASATSLLPWIMIGGMISVGFLMLCSVMGVLGYYWYQETHIPSGVTVAGLAVGGKSTDEATRLLQNNPPHSTVTFIDGSRTWQLSSVELGITVDIPTTVEAAQQAKSNMDIQPRYQIDLAQTQNGLISLGNLVNIAAVPGESPQKGRSLEIPVMMDRIRTDVTGELADGIIELTMIEIEPPPLESINLSYTARTTHIVESGQELGLIAKAYGVTVEDIVAVNPDIENPDILLIGQEIVIPAAGLYEPTAADAPPAPLSTGKSIVVSVADQRIYAYEDGQLIRSHLASTGLPATPTVFGDFKIYVKFRTDDMEGDDYYLEDVPYVMYFYQGYGIHGTYWHNSFGRPMSHGCVNLPPDEAGWFFNWAEVGTLVRVI